MTAAEYRGRAREPKPRPQKYGNRKVDVDGITFDSAREARRWGELQMLERAGEIRDLRRQVRLHLWGQRAPLVSDKGRRLSYVADFVYEDAEGRTVVEDAKGHPTPEYRLKKAILRAMGVEIVEV